MFNDQDFIEFISSSKGKENETKDQKYEIENENLRNLGIVLDSSVETTMIRLYNFIHNLLNNITLLLQILGSTFTIF
jgi:hypothetical protein